MKAYNFDILTNDLNKNLNDIDEIQKSFEDELKKIIIPNENNEQDHHISLDEI